MYSLLCVYPLRLLCHRDVQGNVQGNGTLVLYREVLHTHNCPCQRQSFGAEAARGIGNRLFDAQ
jgi:hypothetical protein